MYNIQIIPVEPNDVLLLHVNKDLDLWDCKEIQKYVKTLYPNNEVIIANEHILQGLTIIRKENVFSTLNLEKEYPDLFNKELSI